MKRTPLDERALPDYSRGNEWFNAISHMVGGALGIVATVLCVVVAAHDSGAYGVVGAAIFGGTMIVLYTISAVYHALNARLRAKKVMQILDHCSIFLLIAGTYTPILFCLVRPHNAALAWVLFGVLWGAAAIGITLNAIDLKKYRAFSMICYLAMGWCIMLCGQNPVDLLGFGGFMLILAGGLAYTIGAVIYLAGAKKPVLHSIFHIFTVIASLFHFLAIVLYVV